MSSEHARKYLSRMRVASRQIADLNRKYPAKEFTVLKCTICGLPYAAERRLEATFVCKHCRTKKDTE